MRKVGLYIHVPFRIYKHNHRGVVSFFNKDFYIKSYFEYIKKEIDLRLDKDLLIESIYIGGGDPSSVDTDYITNILDYIYEKYNVVEDCEKTIELDPQCPEIRVRRYVEHGINRFSIKTFTFDHQGLMNLDLVHDKYDLANLMKYIRKYKIDNINMDMYFAYPDQTLDDLKDDVRILNKLNVPHVSFYSVKTDSQIISYDEERHGEIPEIEYIQEFTTQLEAKGYIHYELNHFCRDGYESHHNMKYWNLDEYIGIGLAAAGFFDKSLYKNSVEFEKYFEMIDAGQLPICEEEILTLEEEEKYFIINRMGLKEGINLEYFSARFGERFEVKYKELLEKYRLQNLIQFDQNAVSFTELGMLNSSKFYMEII